MKSCIVVVDDVWQHWHNTNRLQCLWSLGHCFFGGYCCNASIKGVTLNLLKWSHRVKLFIRSSFNDSIQTHNITITKPKAHTNTNATCAIQPESKKRLIEVCFGYNVWLVFSIWLAT